MRIYLASTEDLYRGRAAVTVRRLLLSYWGKESRFDVSWEHCGKPADWCIDSGAHFFISAYLKKGALVPVEEVEEHIHKYVSWMKEADNKPTWAVEMDLQDLYGIDLIEKWRWEIWKPFEKETGIKVVYNHHITESLDRWQEMLDDPGMTRLALSIPRNKDLRIYGAKVYEAYEAGKPVHGFAQVRKRSMRVIPFYSVDSTSWGAGALFGTVHSFNSQHGLNKTAAAGRSVFKKNPRKAMAALLKSTKGKVRAKDMLGVEAGGSLSRLYQNASDSYMEMEDWYTAYWKVKGVDWDAKLAKAA